MSIWHLTVMHCSVAPVRGESEDNRLLRSLFQRTCFRPRQNLSKAQVLEGVYCLHVFGISRSFRFLFQCIYYFLRHKMRPILNWCIKRNVFLHDVHRKRACMCSALTDHLPPGFRPCHKIKLDETGFIKVASLLRCTYIFPVMTSHSVFCFIALVLVCGTKFSINIDTCSAPVKTRNMTLFWFRSCSRFIRSRRIGRGKLRVASLFSSLGMPR